LRGVFAVEPSPVITLTTDFGLADTYVGILKGVLLSIAPHVQIVDLTHAIAPQNIAEGSARLETAVEFFPPGTIHVAVVDPGVGCGRDAVVVETSLCTFVAPDNGLLTLPLRRRMPTRAIRLTERASRYYRHPVSATFHGRDVFAPIAAHLAGGLSPDELGEACAPETLTTLTLPETEAGQDAQGNPTLTVPLLYSDRFGNLITDLTPERWADWLHGTGRSMTEAAQRVQVQAGRKRWRSLARTFAEVPVGAPLAYWGSAGRLEIAVRDGSAASALSLSLGARITLTL
jgi:S-adenosyl-L-methionine hydrolase (adenosine-forming)